jgi:photosystem II stability/assembly factor-like uncharacterized protein
VRTTYLKLTVAVAAAGFAISACGGAGPQPPAGAAPSEASAGELAVVPASAGHIHGMGINPGDGKLYLGTHTGILVLDGNAVRKVGASTVDLMGFSVAGPDHFYSSGHPGPGDLLPNPVGLLESTDAGKTWKPRSLAGQSDFHALAAAGETVYGYDGTIRSSSDGQTWRAGAAGVEPASLAVDPAHPATVLVTTEQGPMKSVDQGKTFAHLRGAPLLQCLVWASPDALWGVAPDGVVHLSTDGGISWAARGNAGGPPMALTAIDAQTVTVALETEIVSSADGGNTFAAIANMG